MKLDAKAFQKIKDTQFLGDASLEKKMNDNIILSYVQILI